MQENANLTDVPQMITMDNEDIQRMVQAVVVNTVRQTLEAVNLENRITDSSDMLGMEGELNMPKRMRQQITLAGKEVWITGYTQQELFDNYLKRAQQAGLVMPSDANHVEAVERKAPVFKGYANKWMELYKEPKLRQTTRTTYRNLLDRHIIPFFGSMRLNEIGADEIQSFYNAHAQMAKSSVQQMSVILHQIFDIAVEDGYMNRNPTDSKRLTMTNRKSKREALKTDEVKDILSNLSKLDGMEQLTVAVLMLTGMRRGEALGLRWEDIDWEEKLIHVNRAVSFHNNQPIVGAPKTEAGERDIPLEETLFGILENQRKETGYVIGDGVKPLTERTFTRMWERIGKTINLHQATPHILRHTYITMAASSGMDVKTLQEIAGHADIQTTLGRYAHARHEKVIEAGKQIGGVFAEI